MALTRWPLLSFKFDIKQSPLHLLNANQCLFYWGFLAKIRPEKCDFNLYKGFFSWKKWSGFTKFQEKIKFKSLDFYNKFQ